MDLKQILYYIFVMPVTFMKSLIFPVGEYEVSAWNIFVFSFVAFIVVKIVFGMIGGGNDG